MVDQKGGRPSSEYKINNNRIDLKIINNFPKIDPTGSTDVLSPVTPTGAVVFDDLTFAQTKDPMAETIARLAQQEAQAQAKLRQAVDALRARYGLPAVADRNKDGYELWEDEQNETRGKELILEKPER